LRYASCARLHNENVDKSMIQPFLFSLTHKDQTEKIESIMIRVKNDFREMQKKSIY